MFLFFYETIVSGGAETLILRLGRSLRERNIKVRVICRSISEKMKEQYEENGIQIIHTELWNPECLMRRISSDDKIFTFSLLEFLMCESYRQEEKKCCQVFLYLLNPKVLRLERLEKFQMGRKLTCRFFSGFIYRYIQNGNVLFMDEMCLSWTEKFYHRKVENPKEKIYRLPMEDALWKEEIFQKTMERRKEEFQILTIARADFPFKAYIKGLIEDFTLLQKEYPHIRLKVVSYGDGITKVEQWIEKAHSQGAYGIELVGETDYDALEQYYRETNLYVGMGTTLLDGAKCGVISLNTLMHSYAIKTTGFFHEYPFLMGAEKEYCQEALEKIRQAVCYSDEIYERYARDSRKLFQEHYSMDSFLNRILSGKYVNVKRGVPFAVRKAVKWAVRRRNRNF